MSLGNAITGFVNFESIKAKVGFGITNLIPAFIVIANLTVTLDNGFGLNFSCPSPCLDKSIPVLITFLALLEVHKVTTIIAPASNNNQTLEGTFLAKTPIENASAETPETLQAS